MTRQNNDHSWLTSAECADRMGITVRALRLYETAAWSNRAGPARTGVSTAFPTLHGCTKS